MLLSFKTFSTLYNYEALIIFWGSGMGCSNIIDMIMIHEVDSTIKYLVPIYIFFSEK